MRKSKKEKEEAEEPSNSPLWPAFLRFAESEGISTEHKEDWEIWWRCFMNGVVALQEYLKQGQMDVSLDRS